MGSVFDFDKSKDQIYKQGEVREAPKMTWNQYLLKKIQEAKPSPENPISKDLDRDR